MTGIHLVLVDDDDLMLRMLDPALKELPVRPGVRTIETALTPEAAITLIHAAPEGPLVVLSDFNLKAPLNGIDVLREAAKARPHSVRILLSGYAAEQIGDVSGGGHIHGFVEKPLRIMDLFEPVAAIVRAQLLATR